MSNNLVTGKITAIHVDKPEPRQTHYFYLKDSPGSELLVLGDLVSFNILDEKDPNWRHRNTVVNVKKTN
jgi:UDP-2,3-diacylglucosamine pyrophosphatase LpxH